VAHFSDLSLNLLVVASFSGSTKLVIPTGCFRLHPPRRICHKAL
jgi:hypothetical protein